MPYDVFFSPKLSGERSPSAEYHHLLVKSLCICLLKSKQEGNEQQKRSWCFSSQLTGVVALYNANWVAFHLPHSVWVCTTASQESNLHLFTNCHVWGQLLQLRFKGTLACLNHDFLSLLWMNYHQEFFKKKNLQTCSLFNFLTFANKLFETLNSYTRFVFLSYFP